MASGVALLLAFLLATQTFWCGLAGSECECDPLPGLRQIAALTASHSPTSQAILSAVTHSQPWLSDLCAGVDETKNRALFAGLSLVAPLLLWTVVVFVCLLNALRKTPLPRGAAVFGRDGPVSVPPLHSRLVRASLPHRAPPVFLF